MINTFWLVLGYSCNNDCKYCYASPSSNKKAWMPLSYAKDVILTLKKGGAEECLLIGGEPTLYPHIENLISFGSNVGLRMIIITNGRRFSSSNFAKRLFSSGLEKAVISLVSSNKERHDFLTRNKGSFNETTEGIKNCSDIGKVSTLTTICKSNYYKLFDLLKFSYNLGVQKVAFNYAMPVMYEDKVSAEETLDLSKVTKVISDLFKQTKDANLSFHLNVTFPLCLLEKEVLNEMLELGWLSTGCQMYRGSGVAFDAEGNVLPCTHFSDAPLIEKTLNKNDRFSLKDNFFQIWEDSEYSPMKFRKKLWRYPAQECRDCEYWGGCIGGCPLLWLIFNPKTFIKKGGKV